MSKLEAYRKTEWLGPQWDTSPQSFNCDTGPKVGEMTGSCAMRPDLYVEAYNKKGCIDAYIGQKNDGAPNSGHNLIDHQLNTHIDRVARKAGSSY